MIAGQVPLFLATNVGISEGMAQAFVIATTSDAETAGDPPRVLWAVLADTPHLAVEAARASGCEVDRIVEPYPRRPWSALGSSLVSQGVCRCGIVSILADTSLISLSNVMRPPIRPDCRAKPLQARDREGGWP